MINRMILVGRLGDNPKMTETKNGNKVAVFPLPLYHYGAKDGDRTEWVECQVWNRLAEVVSETQKKGNLVYVEGELSHTSWKNDKGEWRNRTFVTASLIRFLTPKGNNDNKPSEMSASDIAPIAPQETYEEYKEETPPVDTRDSLMKELDDILL